MQQMTAPERAVAGALTKLGVSFTSQSSMIGGRQTKGGAVVDFEIPSLNIAIAVQGLYWHYGARRSGRDALQRVALESRGVKVIYIDEDHALQNALFYVKEALEGKDHSRMTQ